MTLPAQESTFGWLRLGCTGAGLFYLPIWAVLTATIIQLNPDLWLYHVSISDDRVVAATRTPVEVLLIGGFSAAVWLTVATVILLAIFGVWWVVLRLRGRGIESRDAITFMAADWSVRTVHTGEESPAAAGGTISAPEPEAQEEGPQLTLQEAISAEEEDLVLVAEHVDVVHESGEGGPPERP